LTLTNPDAPQWVTRLIREDSRFRNGDAMLGIGSVRNLQEVHRVIAAGAQFVVTPILSVPVIEACVARSIPIAAGAYSPTEIAAAWDAGATLVKVFPARSLGHAYIRDVLSPMPDLRLIPTGGIDASNARGYLDAGAVAVGIGGSLCREDWIVQGDWNAIRQAAQDIVKSTAP
jgi:2-dehydro-3-deoxyphosphogluconate aldolase/(4S)-4-hydroxy-2-oxoglutarate aldolase